MSLPVGYLIGLGSNIEPERHFPQILSGLLEISPTLIMSRVHRTKPKGIQSEQNFLNAVVFIPTELSPEQLKEKTNAIEAALGRDRSRPDKKLIDRTADIDLLIRTHPTQDDKVLDTIESYLLPSAREVFQVISGRPALSSSECQYQSIELNGIRLGQTPATIHRDDRTGLIRVVEYC